MLCMANFNLYGTHRCNNEVNDILLYGITALPNKLLNGSGLVFELPITHGFSSHTPNTFESAGRNWGHRLQSKLERGTTFTKMDDYLIHCSTTLISTHRIEYQGREEVQV